MHYNSEFFNACRNGHLEVAKQLVYSYPQINISACKYGHLEVAKWLVESIPTNKYKYICL